GARHVLRDDGGADRDEPRGSRPADRVRARAIARAQHRVLHGAREQRRARAAAEAALEHDVRRAAQGRCARRARQPAPLFRHSDAERVRAHRARCAEERGRDDTRARRAPRRSGFRRADGGWAPLSGGPLAARPGRGATARGAIETIGQEPASVGTASRSGRRFPLTDLELAHLHRRISQLKEEARKNEEAWKRAQARAMELLEADDLKTLLVRATDGLRTGYRLEAATLLIADEEREIRHLLMSEGA